MSPAHTGRPDQSPNPAGSDVGRDGQPGPNPAADPVDEAELMDDQANAEAPAGVAGSQRDSADVSVEALLGDLERVTVERDQYLDTSRRVQAEFENYRKQVTKREADARDRANDGLIQELLPVLDAFDAALASGVESVGPMRRAMLDALVKHGLERIDPVGTDTGAEPFDPNVHEAVVHAEGDSGQAGPEVAEVMRAGYAWKGRVVRPAMVSVRG